MTKIDAPMARNLRWLCFGGFAAIAGLLTLPSCAQPTGRTMTAVRTNPPQNCNASNTYCYRLILTRDGTSTPKIKVYDSSGSAIVDRIRVEHINNTGGNPTTLKWFIDRDRYPATVSGCAFVDTFADADTSNDPWIATPAMAGAPPVEDAFPANKRKVRNNSNPNTFRNSVIEVSDTNDHAASIYSYDYKITMYCTVDNIANTKVDSDPAIDNMGEN
ncbi:MAG: hypothetical protein SFV19_06275 [Rhodospirillaceae bacterium]|nr:hypothetical protein [Rhodospirillaceae bacterium]